MTPPASLTAALAALLGDARLRLQALPSSDLSLWLIDPTNMTRAFSPSETQRLLEAPPYWCFCWASGLALAQWIAAHPQAVAGRQVLDFGSGSGIAGLAAAQAGAARVVCCDLDPLALAACRANAAANDLHVETLEDLNASTEPFELILAADVLYDRANLPLLALLQQRAERVLLADSRVRDLDHPGFTRLTELQACTLPDLAEPDEFRRVALYQG
ncbi:class I SAM-dependent methyltransferase [Pseudomonas rhizoryzae]|uniref:class I SAM-dependent methyltransferase n=1 Tax=Pseudomonas rhizoryzae TaxID=2571129 RepID=UPI0007361558|nr:50S ribosomal protein L11 methyltransferase [Pseudomonas rhizoryzae]KTT29989.1 methyltransferase [Pseudomonas psychrotolerans]KTT35266.1 methyltransferase [Pseudomonas psychrotolerans]KTT75975.1 methyltransferase [Pseudomonas psychrotolerans]